MPRRFGSARSHRGGIQGYPANNLRVPTTYYNFAPAVTWYGDWFKENSLADITKDTTGHFQVSIKFINWWFLGIEDQTLIHLNILEGGWLTIRDVTSPTGAIQWTDGVPNVVQIFPNITVAINTWYLLTLTGDGDTITANLIALDGSSDTVGVIKQYGQVTVAARAQVARRSAIAPEDNFLGGIAEIHYYEGADNGDGTITPTLMMEYMMDDGVGATTMLETVSGLASQTTLGGVGEWVPDDSFITRVLPADRISLDKILIIHDSTNPESEAVADDYIELRGLTTAHKLGIDLSATVDDGADWFLDRYPDDLNPNKNYYDAFTVPIWNYIQANNIEAVFLSGMTPTRVRTYDSTGDAAPDGFQLTSLANFAGSSGHFVNNGEWPHDDDASPLPGSEFGFSGGPNTTQARGQQVVVGGYQRFGSGAIQMFTVKPGWTAFDADPGEWYRPWGRIGMAGQGANPPWVTETRASIRRQIVRAIASERSLAAVAAEQLPFQVGAYERIPNVLKAVHCSAIVDCCKRLGFNVKYFYRQAANFASGFAHEVTPIEGAYADYDEVVAQTGPQNQPTWCYLGYAMANDTYTDPWMLSTWDHMQGSWGYEGTSVMRHRFRLIVSQGGIGGISNEAEPFPDDGRQIFEWYWNLLQGVSMCEAHYHTSHKGTWVSYVSGDPLYAPFGKS